MRGNNEFRLNEATMIEIVQEWVDRTFIKDRATIVTGVGAHGSPAEFTVHLSDEPKESS